MNKNELIKKRDDLQKKYDMLQDAHSKKFSSNVNESQYLDSCAKMNEVYEELFLVSRELGEPIAKKF